VRRPWRLQVRRVRRKALRARERDCRCTWRAHKHPLPATTGLRAQKHQLLRRRRDAPGFSHRPRPCRPDGDARRPRHDRDGRPRHLSRRGSRTTRRAAGRAVHPLRGGAPPRERRGTAAGRLRASRGSAPARSHRNPRAGFASLSAEYPHSARRSARRGHGGVESLPLWGSTLVVARALRHRRHGRDEQRKGGDRDAARRSHGSRRRRGNWHPRPRWRRRLARRRNGPSDSRR
jgi:hypothetical protein